MGEAGRLAENAAQAKAALGVEIGDLQPAIVEGEAFRGRGFEKEFAIVRTNQRLVEHTARIVGVKFKGGERISGHDGSCTWR